MKYLTSLQDSLAEIMAENQNIHIIGEDIAAPYGGAFKVTKKAAEKFPGRVLNTPICEASIIGMATGLAIRGFPTIAEIMFGDFILIAADQIINEAAKFNAMFDGRLEVPLVIRTPMGAGRGYGPVHSQSLEKFFLGVPGLKVVSPSHYHIPGESLAQCIKSNSPTLFAEHKLLYPKQLMQADTVATVEGFKIVEVSNSSSSAFPDVVIIGYGGMSRVIEEALSELASEEINAKAYLPELISDVSPKTINSIKTHIPQNCPVIVIDEVEKEFGWAVQTAYSLMQHGINANTIHVVSRNCEIIPTCFDLEQELIISAEKVTTAVYKALGIS